MNTVFKDLIPTDRAGVPLAKARVKNEAPERPSRRVLQLIDKIQPFRQRLPSQDGLRVPFLKRVNCHGRVWWQAISGPYGVIVDRTKQGQSFVRCGRPALAPAGVPASQVVLSDLRQRSVGIGQQAELPIGLVLAERPR